MLYGIDIVRLISDLNSDWPLTSDWKLTDKDFVGVGRGWLTLKTGRQINELRHANADLWEFVKLTSS